MKHSREDISLEEQVERIRRKRMRFQDHSRLRAILNTVFLILAAIGLAMYFWNSENHVPAMVVIAVGMLVKVAEFFVRFLL